MVVAADEEVHRNQTGYLVVVAIEIVKNVLQKTSHYWQKEDDTVRLWC